MPRQQFSRRRRLSSKHLVMIAVLALVGSGGTFALVTGTASAHWRSDSSATATATSSADVLAGRRNGGRNKGRNGGNNNAGAGAGATASASASAGAGGGADTGNGAPTRVAGPAAEDFVDITKVSANVQGKPANQGNAATGTFTSNCGTNAEGQHNSDNVIVAPGVVNGAHHIHDYVGNKDVSGASTNESLAAEGTSCSNGDQSAYYWPVLRDLTKVGADADLAQGGGGEGNVGAILVADSASIVYKGSPASKVVAMPRFLRIITGDAKTLTNGLGNANAHWSCTGFEDKVQLTEQYPICPQGSKVVRSFSFQNCWDGANTDSANHRTHVAFADAASGVCPSGFVAIPTLTMRLVYTVPSGPNYAVDGFQSELHKASTDHDDFINVMSEQLMNQAVQCINSGKKC
ncbi:DUF1996 domain-containing protein [Streptomyces sp. NBC_01262]|uniref:DUF1996 domain-containing protein n=1 Tax=Streptomyces sp. NBC_01262 TaxID=2903803 RepID=UPI002E2EFE56|nr:DUF1996 domain-containing protein [Streptomyces sp. NBC_01262]